MDVLSDTKILFARLSSFEIQCVYDLVIKRYKQEHSSEYRYFLKDKRNGVYIRHLPINPYMNFTTMLTFHSYSNDSSLLRDIFNAIPLDRWFVKRLDIAFDNQLPIHQQHVIHPAKRADVKHYKGSMYMGSRRSAVQLHMYDKQQQQMNRGRVADQVWTRMELRFRFTPMKRISDLHVGDFVAAAQYNAILDIESMPSKQLQLVQQLNVGLLKWTEVTRANQRKIREYGSSEGINLYDLILSNISDIEQFIYTIDRYECIVFISERIH